MVYKQIDFLRLLTSNDNCFIHKPTPHSKLHLLLL